MKTFYQQQKKCKESTFETNDNVLFIDQKPHYLPFFICMTIIYIRNQLYFFRLNSFIFPLLF